MKKVSIIIPVYNAEKYIERCINSVINQTLKDIEVILINDGSKDNSQNIIDKYKDKYPEILKTKTIENSGAANARNVGLELAEGEYIGFIDSDDYVERDMFEKLYIKAKKEECDIVVSGYFIEQEEKIKSYQLGYLEQYNQNIKDNPNIFIYGVPYLWNKIFKRELITKNNIKFNKFRIFEDLEFVYKLFLEANKISKVDEPLYYYIKENESSLTAKFSDKFFDIIPAMKSLNKYAKNKDYYNEIKAYILFIALNHIFIRCNMKVSRKQIKMKLKYIDEVFEFLDEEFENWKKYDYFFKNKKKSKIKYTSKMYWKMKSFLQIINIDKSYKKMKKAFKQFIKYDRSGKKYIKYYHKLPIDDKVILIDSQHGNDINGNMFYILKELNENSSYNDYKIYLGVEKNRIIEFKSKLDCYNIKNINLVPNKTKKYMKILATTKYLFTDTSFSPFFIKKEGQVYLNTWHGTPLKAMGRSTKNDFENIANLQKNFVVSDYLLYPSEYMIEHMLEDYMIDNIAKNKILLCGYPRNSIFLNEDRRKEVKKQLNLENKEIIVYMPTWRGTLGKKDTEEYISTLKQFLNQLSSKLNKNQLLYVNVHPYIKDYINYDEYENILAFPKQYETYDFVNICDTLITDYSSVFFDFALTRKKIILFTYDEQRYLSERGLYISLDSLPFPRVYNVEDLVDEINNKDNVQYEEFIEKFCKYDNLNVSKNICEMMILNKKNDLKLLEMPNNKKKNVLILLDNFSDKNINKEFFRLAENTEELQYNFYVGYISKKVRKYAYNLVKLPKNIKYMGQLFYMCNASIKDRVLLKICRKLKNSDKIKNKKYKKILSDEIKRIYGDINFDVILVMGENDNVRIDLFAQYENSLKVYYSLTNNIKLKDYIFIEKKSNKYKNLNDIIKKAEKIKK